MSSTVDDYKFVPIASRILHAWDPIGVYDDPEHAPAGEEYDSYVPAVIALLLRDADIEEIASHLSAIRTANMGLEPNDGADRNTAVTLMASFQQFQSDA